MFYAAYVTLAMSYTYDSGLCYAYDLCVGPLTSNYIFHISVVSWYQLNWLLILSLNVFVDKAPSFTSIVQEV